VVEVAAGLIFHQGRLLIAQRHTKDHLGDLWEFPGGKREPGETFEACLYRELVEELDVRVQVGKLLHTVSHDYPEKSVHLRFFQCKLMAGEPRALGCQALAWVTREELRRYAFPAADAQLLQLLEANLGLWDIQ
jgi:mutator protein MutT